MIGLAHQFERERAIEDLLETTFAMGDPPQWPDGYQHRDAKCPAKDKKVLL